ncbi:MAG: FecR family protein [Spirochaetota bacterium]
MKRLALLSALCALTMSFFACNRTADAGAANDAPAVAVADTSATGTVNEIVGKAYLVKEGVTAPAAIGDIVAKGTTIRTAAGAKLTFKVESVGVFNIKESSEVLVDGLIGAPDKNVRLKVTKGKLLVGIRKLVKDESAIIETPSSIAAVRGTSFVVDSSSQDTKISVLTGMVNVKSDKGNVDVNELKEVTATADGKIELVAITKESLSDVKEIVTMKDLGSIRDVGALKDNLKKLSLMLEAKDDGAVGKADVRIDAADIKAREAMQKGDMEATTEVDAKTRKKFDESKELMIKDKKEY